MLTAALLLASVLAKNDQPHPRYTTRQCPKGPAGRSSRGVPCDDGAFFEFAPANGRGIGSTCACAAVTGAKGEAVTWTRGSSATCTKGGFATTGIANGDLATCTNNLPRVELDANGVAGVLVEEARTNSLLRSQELTTAPWGTSAVGVAVPSLTADFGVAPDGTTTAERVQFPACPSVGNSSAVFQSVTTTATSWSNSIYVKGNGTSGSVLVWLYDTGASGGTGVVCSFVAASWSRCSVTRTMVGAGGSLGFGCYHVTDVTNNQDTGAADLLVWGGQVEAGAWASSYVPTTSAGVTRAADYASLDVGASAPAGNLLSFAGTLTPEWGGSAGAQYATVLQVDHISTADTTAGSGINTPSSFGASWRAYTSNTTPTLFATGTSAVTITAGLAFRGYAYADGSNLNGSMGGTSFSASGAISGSWSPARYVSIGGATGVAAGSPNGIISRLCVDPSPTRCR